MAKKKDIVRGKGLEGRKCIDVSNAFGDLEDGWNNRERKKDVEKPYWRVFREKRLAGRERTRLRYSGGWNSPPCVNVSNAFGDSIGDGWRN